MGCTWQQMDAVTGQLCSTLSLGPHGKGILRSGCLYRLKRGTGVCCECLHCGTMNIFSDYCVVLSYIDFDMLLLAVNLYALVLRSDQKQ